MKIGRENYELYVLDFLDGKLPEEDRQMFIKFLKDNPDIYEEVRDICNLQLQPADAQFPDKEILKKNSHTIGFQNDFEHYCIASLEGDMESADQINFKNYLSENPGKIDELELFRKVYLKADLSISYSQKSKLKKLTVFQKRIRIVSMISTAAAVLVLFLLFVKPFNKANIFHISKDDQKELQTAPQIGSNIERLEQSGVDTSGLNNSEYADNQKDKKGLHNHQKEIQIALSKLPLSTKGNHYNKVDSARINISIDPISPIQAQIVIPRQHVYEILKRPGLEKDNIFAEYQTIGEFAINSLLSEFFISNELRTNEKITFWDLASRGFEGLNRISEGGYALNRETNENGSSKRISLETPIVGISIPMKNKNTQ